MYHMIFFKVQNQTKSMVLEDKRVVITLEVVQSLGGRMRNFWSTVNICDLGADHMSVSMLWTLLSHTLMICVCHCVYVLLSTSLLLYK